MVPPFDDHGLLPAGIHEVKDWQEFIKHFGFSARRQRLLKGLQNALRALKIAGCQRAYVDGSFVTAKADPNDFDACWDVAGVDPDKLDPVLLQFDANRSAQKVKFLGELFPAHFQADLSGTTFLGFFQVDKHTGGAKGIILLPLTGMNI